MRQGLLKIAHPEKPRDSQAPTAEKRSRAHAIRQSAVGWVTIN